MPLEYKMIFQKVTVLAVIFLWQTITSTESFSCTTFPNGSYSVKVGYDVWLQSDDTLFSVNNTLYSLKKGTLKPNATKTVESGIDAFGPYSKDVFSYTAGKAIIQVDVKTYSNNPNILIFSQTFNTDAYATSVKNKDGIISRFPSFKVGESKLQLGYMAYSSVFSGYNNFAIDKLENGMADKLEGLNSGPLVIFDDADHVLILSPFSHFMAASHFFDKDSMSINWGIMGNVDSVPKGYKMETIMYYSSRGINQAMQGWGKKLMEWYDRDTSARDSDPTVNYLGYYTDNGAYYYHKTETGQNYEDTLLDNMYYYKKLGIPYQYIQLDDWWYYVEHTKTSYGAVLKWETMPQVFPHGLEWFYNKVGLPIIAHNRYWSYETPLAKQNGGRFEFIIDNDTGFALPLEQSFWDELFKNGTKWGLVNYEQFCQYWKGDIDFYHYVAARHFQGDMYSEDVQASHQRHLDFLITQMNEIRELNSDIFLAEKWLNQMGDSALKYNLKLQYCMSLPRQVLQSLQVPAVSQARVSTDYTNDNQWRIGLTSLFTDSLGVAPFKDNFWTTKVQPGNRWGRTEVNPLREAVISLLSTGPVGISDRIGYTDPQLAKALCRADGLLLKPSRALTAIDQQVIQRAFGGVLGKTGEVYTTYSEVTYNKFGVIFASQLSEDFSITPKMAGLYTIQETVVYSFNSSTLPVSFSDAQPLVLKKFDNDVDMHLYYISPVFTISRQKVSLLGELSKLLPMSPQRVTSITVEQHHLYVTLAGPPSEKVVFHFLMNGKPYSATCVMNEDSQATLSVMEKACY